jgi:hypothetical protein
MVFVPPPLDKSSAKSSKLKLLKKLSIFKELMLPFSFIQFRGFNTELRSNGYFGEPQALSCASTGETPVPPVDCEMV